LFSGWFVELAPGLEEKVREKERSGSTECGMEGTETVGDGDSRETEEQKTVC
jgi:hypothetical protein